MIFRLTLEEAQPFIKSEIYQTDLQYLQQFFFPVTAQYSTEKNPTCSTSVSFIRTINLGQQSRMECATECLKREECYMVSFLPAGGSTKLGICLLLLTSGGEMAQYQITGAWQHYGMSDTKCDRG